MTWALALSFAEALAWPVVALVIAFTFRGKLGDLLSLRLGGAEAQFQRREEVARILLDPSPQTPDEVSIRLMTMSEALGGVHLAITRALDDSSVPHEAGLDLLSATSLALSHDLITTNDYAACAILVGLKQTAERSNEWTVSRKQARRFARRADELAERIGTVETADLEP